MSTSTSAPQSNFHLGAKFDTPHRRRMYASALGPKGLFKTSPTLTTGTKSLAEYEALVLDQGASGSCESNSGGMATWMAFAAMGTPLPWFPSQDGHYKDIRCLERVPNADGSLPPLQDTGGMTSDSITAYRTCGIRPMGPMAPDGRNSDIDPATMNHEPTLDELDYEAESLILVDPSAFAVDLSDTKQAIAVIQAALGAGYPVRIDIFADYNFQRFFQSWRPGTPPLSTCDANDPNGGGHAIVLGELEVRSDFSFTAAGLNSWGETGAAPLVAAGKNPFVGHWHGDARWFEQAVVQATIWKCSRI